MKNIKKLFLATFLITSIFNFNSQAMENKKTTTEEVVEYFYGFFIIFEESPDNFLTSLWNSITNDKRESLRPIFNKLNSLRGNKKKFQEFILQNRASLEQSFINPTIKQDILEIQNSLLRALLQKDFHFMASSNQLNYFFTKMLLTIVEIIDNAKPNSTPIQNSEQDLLAQKLISKLSQYLLAYSEVKKSFTI